MSDSRRVAIAADLGASSGRVLAARFDGNRIEMTEVHRFANQPVALGNHLYWDFPGLYREVLDGLRAAARDVGNEHATLGVDTWAVDFGLIDETGELLANPVHYRDARNDGIMESVLEREGAAERIFAVTGIQFIPFNTLYQLLALRAENPRLLDCASQFLMMPDLIHYFLTGEQACEFTNATSTQLVDARTRNWSDSLLEDFEIPQHLFPEIRQPGTILGRIAGPAREGIGPALRVISVATHDTGSAVVGVPSPGGEPFAYLSCGTWSLLGTEITEPCLGPDALAANLTNEGGFGGTIRLLKNIMGLWIVQEMKRGWECEGRAARGWDELLGLAEAAPPFAALFDPDDRRFLAPGNMPERIAASCRETNQAPPESEGAFLRTVFESLALKYRFVLERIESIAGTRFPALHIVGGGCQNALLCQMTANATGRPVIAGPVEATALGNIGVQLIATGEAAGLDDVRRLVRQSIGLITYEPASKAAWEAAYATFLDLLT